MKITLTITAEHGAGGAMESAIALAKAASDADLDKLAALGRCLTVAVKAERGKRQPAETSPAKKTPATAREGKTRRMRKFNERFHAAATRVRRTRAREML